MQAQAVSSVTSEKRNGVVLATLNRPDRLNAFTVQQYVALREVLEGALADDEVGAVLISGAGRAFSAGADMSLLAGAEDGGGDSLSAAKAFESLLDGLGSFEKPLLAAVNGLAVGIGATLLLHCDVVIAAESARIRFPFTALGLVPEAGSTYLLPVVVGPQMAAELFFSAEWIGAQRASELGIASRVVADDRLLEVALARAEEIAAQPLGALRATKRILLDARREAVEAARRREGEGMLAQAGSAENLAALAALAKRRS